MWLVQNFSSDELLIITLLFTYIESAQDSSAVFACLFVWLVGCCPPSFFPLSPMTCKIVTAWINACILVISFANNVLF
jgi:hypothetical protein